MRRLLSLFVTPLILAGCDFSFVGPLKISSITIEPGNITVAENQSVVVTAVVRDAMGNVVEEQPDWRSQDDYIASVMFEPGRIMAYAAGTTIIEARLRGQVGKATVTVVPGAVDRIVAFPERQAIASGQRFLIDVSTLDANGGYLRSRPATLTTSDPAVATTSGSQVIGVAPGTASIIVTVDGKSDTVFVKVVPNTVTYTFYKRGSTSAGTATVTYSNNLYQATLAIDGRVIPVQMYADFDTGLLCLTSPYPVNQATDGITACAFNPSPLVMRLCTGQVQQLQYVLMPAADTGRVTSTATALLAAVPTSPVQTGIGVYNNCVPGAPSTRWLRNAAATDYTLWPNPSIYSAAAMTTMLDGAAIFSARTPNASNMYAAVRMTATVFEVWH